MNQLPFVPLFSTSFYQLTGVGIRRKVLNQNLRSHAQTALNWIEQATKVSNDGGISKGFDLLRGRWAPSYPETTGYTIPTLLNASNAYQNPRWKELAFALAEHELKNSTDEGGVVHWKSKKGAVPIVFDTGQVIFGWLAAYQSNSDNRFLQAAQRAGDWLTSIQAPDGSWKSNQHLGITKVIDTRVAWSLLELFAITSEKSYRDAAERNLFWAIEQQDETGWFHQCAFRPQDAPYTHTLAYTAEGLLECGLVLNDSHLITSTRKTADALKAIQRPDGSLAGTYGSKWSHPSRWSCLTGNCQMARLWLKIYQTTKEPSYLEAGERAIQYVASIQDIHTPNTNLRGAIPGSQPLWGEYERFKLPNWAAKFFVDAVLQLSEVEHGKKLIRYSG